MATPIALHLCYMITYILGEENFLFLCQFEMHEYNQYLLWTLLEQFFNVMILE